MKYAIHTTGQLNYRPHELPVRTNSISQTEPWPEPAKEINGFILQQTAWRISTLKTKRRVRVDSAEIGIRR